MAPANLRRAAGVGVVAAFLLVGGPSMAMAIADPGGSHSGHSGSGKGSDSSGRASINTTTRSALKSPTSTPSDAPRMNVASGSGAGTSSQRPGADYSPAPSGSFKAPKVTFGDGRTPDVQESAAPRTPYVAPQPAPPPPPVVTAPPPSWVHRVLGPPVVSQELGVRQAADLTDPLWGVAGLLLIPAAGAILGYRQARAAQAAAELGRHP